MMQKPNIYHSAIELFYSILKTDDFCCSVIIELNTIKSYIKIYLNNNLYIYRCIYIYTFK